ncbi:hypothetical protein [uncultured Flavobacterium sp.]|uniref:hypothetical protein n=1 Tax=uncultured Flavobacterium sp. TaxID=165435 RepID=UPI0030CA1DC6
MENVDVYLTKWNTFFEEWKKNPKVTFKEDKVWSKHKGKVKSDTKKKDTKLEYDVLPQPYLGNITNHSVITLNLNPCRTKQEKSVKEFKKNLDKFNNASTYYEYAKDFPTYDIGFWQDQANWFKRMFIERMEFDIYKKPFAIEICPWNSESWLALKINEEIVNYLDENVFTVIEKAIKDSDIKIVFSVGKAYYDIFNHKKSCFKKIEEFTKSQKNGPFDLDIHSEDQDLKSKIIVIWPKKQTKNTNPRYVNRSFSFWKKNNVTYFNTWSPGSNNPPSRDFIEIESELIKKYLK